MDDTTNKFDLIPRLQQIAATIKECGATAYLFDAPATDAYYIQCAIKEIERLREENRQLRELKMQGVVSEPVKATPPKYDLGDDQ